MRKMPSSACLVKEKPRINRALPIMINGTIGNRMAGNWPRMTAMTGVKQPSAIAERGFKTMAVKNSIRLTNGPVTGCGKPISSTASVRAVRTTKRARKTVLRMPFN